MSDQEQLWVLEDAMMEEPSDLMTLPEFRQRVGRELHDEDLGVRALLETPDELRDFAGWEK